MRFLAAAVAILIQTAAAQPAPQPAILTPEQVSAGWIQLFDGETLFGWTAEKGAQWRVESAAITADSGASGWLRTNVPFADFRLIVEFKAGPGTNSGIFLRHSLDGNPWETGYELQIWDKHPKFPTASLVNHHRSSRASLAKGDWHTFDVTVRGNSFTVRLDGKTVLRARDAKSPAGHIGLQYNPGHPIAFRKIILRPLDQACLFDGTTLNGWRAVQPVHPAAQPAEFSVRDGAIHAEKGPGQLETIHAWDDFVLQADIRANSPSTAAHADGGIFFRGDRESPWSGYESQILNHHLPGDPAKPVDFGTGGIKGLQPARRIVASDNDWFTKTIVASGRHIAVWVNGYPVTSFTDSRPEGLGAPSSARLLRGTISLQMHSPEANFDFRNICISPLRR